MPFCNTCGSRVPDAASYCQACGSRIPPSPVTSAPAGPPSSTRPAPRTSGQAVLPDLQPLPIPADLPFHPQSDEVLYREIVPHPRLRWRLMLGGLLSALVFLVLIVPFTISFLAGGVTSATIVTIVVFLIVVFLLVVVVSVVYATLAYGKFRYWITNHRTVGRRGVIGYSIDSIPLETISDVMVQRSVADRILGLSSVWVQPFGGGSVGGYGAAQYRFGGLTQSNSFLGLLPGDATSVQQLIFHLRDSRRRETARLI